MVSCEFVFRILQAVRPVGHLRPKVAQGDLVTLMQEVSLTVRALKGSEPRQALYGATSERRKKDHVDLRLGPFSPQQRPPGKAMS